MATTPRTPPVTLNDFKKRFGPRDFKFGEGTETVMDSDIANAMTDALAVYNPALFSPADGVVAFLTLTAHFVRTNIEAAGGLQTSNEGLGVQNQGEQVLSGAGAVGVSANYINPPDWVKRFPLLQQLWVTTYGQKYCAMVQPMLVGNVGVVEGPVSTGAQGSPSVPFAEY